MIKLGLIGTWHVHFSGYVRQALNRGDCEVAALWEENETWGKAAADEYGCPYYADADEFFKQDFDAVLCCAATNRHPELLTKAALAGKHIFTEKVLCIQPEDARKVRDAVLANGVKFCISFPWRARGDFHWIKKAIEEGLFGQITYCRMRNAHNGVSGNWLPPHFLDAEACGGGAMMDLGAHGMYLMNWFLGTPVSAKSTFTNCICKSVEDNAVTVLQYADGAIGVSETGFVAQNNPFSLEIVGTKGTVLCGGADDKTVYNIGDGWQSPELPENEKSPLDVFLDAVQDDSVVIPYTIDDAVALTDTMALAYRSAK